MLVAAAIIVLPVPVRLPGLDRKTPRQALMRRIAVFRVLAFHGSTSSWFRWLYRCPLVKASRPCPLHHYKAPFAQRNQYFPLQRRFPWDSSVPPPATSGS